MFDTKISSCTPFVQFPAVAVNNAGTVPVFVSVRGLLVALTGVFPGVKIPKFIVFVAGEIPQVPKIVTLPVAVFEPVLATGTVITTFGPTVVTALFDKILPVKVTPAFNVVATAQLGTIFPAKLLFAPSVVAPDTSQNTSEARAPLVNTRMVLTPVVSAPLTLKM